MQIVKIEIAKTWKEDIILAKIGQQIQRNISNVLGTKDFENMLDGVFTNSNRIVG